MDVPAMPALPATQPLLELIARSALLGDLPPRVLDALLPSLEPLELAGGQTLCRRGEPSDALYLLCSGSLGAFGPGHASDEERLLGWISPGQTVGELGVLARRPRTATVRALRDCTLLRLRDTERLLQLMAAHPEVLARMLAELLGRVEWREEARHLNPPRTFALLPAHPGLPLRQSAQFLLDALAPLGSALLVDSALGHGRDPQWHDQREREHRFVVYLPDGDADWRERCIRQADQFLLLAREDDTAREWPDEVCRRGADALHRARHLLLLAGDAPAPTRATAAWLERFEAPVSWHHLRGRADWMRVGRLLGRRATGLVLSGGGARGFGHLGVVRALRELGMPIDALGGTSIGAIVAAGVACEWDDQQLLERMHQAVVAGHPLRDLTVPLIALTRGNRATRLLRAAFESRRIEELPLPFFCTSANLTAGRVAVHTQGMLWKWLRAGAAIPGILPPLLDRGMVHVDGAVLNNLPTDVMHDAGIHDIIAVDIGSEDSLPATFEDAALPTLPRLTWQWMHGRQWPSLFAILARSAMVHDDVSSKLRRGLATHLLTPPHHSTGLLNSKDYQRLIDSAYDYTLRYFEQRDRTRA
ncbi:MAG: patatin-like phospholipase family protein [Betaproteobacteria bacterium]|nr:patatin-like phospholipase family protein [Betaproteobacteria bacterium]